jgi:hypothetical protein
MAILEFVIERCRSFSARVPSQGKLPPLVQIPVLVGMTFCSINSVSDRVRLRRLRTVARTFSFPPRFNFSLHQKPERPWQHLFALFKPMPKTIQSLPGYLPILTR